MKSDFRNEIEAVCADVRYNEYMSKHTTFKIGGAAEVFATPSSKEELSELVGVCKKHNVNYTIVGNGSNILVRDGGIDGVVINISDKLSKVEIFDTTIKAEAGILLSKLANAALGEGLSGLEFAAGIPGTLGGGVYMNAGAYGGELANVVKSVEYADENGYIKTASGEELDFGYRKSMFSGKKFIILSCIMELEKGDATAIKAAMSDYNKRRAEKQPLSLPSAGSTFKRPEGYFAGALIEQAGLKGYSAGGASVSEKHAGFIVNNGGAASKDVERVIEHVRACVKEKFGVVLEPEVRIMGKNDERDTK